MYLTGYQNIFGTPRINTPVLQVNSAYDISCKKSPATIISMLQDIQISVVE